MLNMIQADLFKMYKSPVLKFLFILTSLCGVIMTLMAYYIPKGQIDSQMTGLGFMFSDVNMISILGGVVAGTFICGDFDNKTIHSAIAGGCSRISIIISKAIVFFCGIVILLLPYAVLVIITLNMNSEFNMGSVALGFLNLMTDQTSRTFTSSGYLKLIVVMLTLLLVYISQLSICVPLALVIRKPVLVVAIYYGLTILFAQIYGIKGNSTFETIFSNTPFGGNHSLLTLASSTNDLMEAIGVSLFFLFLMLALTYTLFRKSEI